MDRPYLSVVIPAYNEAACIAESLSAVATELDRLGQPWEIIVADDGSEDQTGAIVRDRQRLDARVRLITEPHLGKGAAVRRGMLAATGAWRFLADADLSMPIDQLRRFLPVSGEIPADIVIGSREATGSRRLEEPHYRHVLGRFFNWMTKAVVVGGIDDTQCGFKLFSAESAAALFPYQQLDGFGFDVEILYLAHRAGFIVREIPITWVYRDRSKVNAFSGAAGFVDLLRVRWNQVRGAYPPVTQARESARRDVAAPSRGAARPDVR